MSSYALDDVVAQLPRGSQDAFNPRHYRQVARAVTLQTALSIELSFYREQADDRAVAIWQQTLQAVVAGISARIEQDLSQQNLVGGMEPRLPPPAPFGWDQGAAWWSLP